MFSNMVRRRSTLAFLNRGMSREESVERAEEEDIVRKVQAGAESAQVGGDFVTGKAAGWEGGGSGGCNFSDGKYCWGGGGGV